MKMVEPVKPNRKSGHVNAEISSLFIAIRPFVDFPGNKPVFIPQRIGSFIEGWTKSPLLKHGLYVSVAQ